MRRRARRRPARSSCSERPETGKRTPPRCRSAMSTSRRSATSRTPSYSTVSPEIQSTPCSWPSQRSAKPITSPTIGVAQRRAVTARRGGDLDRRPARLLRASCVAHGSSPRALPPSRFAPDAVVIDRRRPTGAAPARPDRGCRRGGRGSAAPRRSARARRRRSPDPASLRDNVAPAELVPLARRDRSRVGQQPPAADLDQGRRTADVGQPHV